jgi:hypothetical protein
MIILGILLALAAPSHAQIAPPLPETASVEPLPSEKLDELFRQFTSGRPMIPTLNEARAAQLRGDLAQHPSEGGSFGTTLRTDFALRRKPPLTNVRRTTSERMDVAVSRPVSPVEIGMGSSETNVYEGNRHLEDDKSVYAFLRIDFSKNPLARKLFHSPTAVHTKTEVGEHVRVASDEYSVPSN